MTLEWIRQSPSGFLAYSADDDYLVTWDDHMAVLTRWARYAGTAGAARQAALNAIQLGGAYDLVPDVATEGVLGYLKRMAQEYESGLDLGSYPAWRH